MFFVLRSCAVKMKTYPADEDLMNSESDQQRGTTWRLKRHCRRMDEN